MTASAASDQATVRLVGFAAFDRFDQLPQPETMRSSGNLGVRLQNKSRSDGNFPDAAARRAAMARTAIAVTARRVVDLIV